MSHCHCLEDHHSGVSKTGNFNYGYFYRSHQYHLSTKVQNTGGVSAVVVITANWMVMNRHAALHAENTHLTDAARSGQILKCFPLLFFVRSFYTFYSFLHFKTPSSMPYTFFLSSLLHSSRNCIRLWFKCQLNGNSEE